MEKITFDESEAIATNCLRESGDPLEIVPRESRSNGSDEVKTEKYEASAKWTDSAQKWKEITSGWSAKVGIGGEKHIRGDCSFEYHRGETEKDIENKSFEISKVFKDDVVINPHSSCEVTVVRVETEYTADIKKLRLKFPHDTKLRICHGKGLIGKMLLSEILKEKILYKKDKDDNTCRARWQIQSYAHNNQSSSVSCITIIGHVRIIII